MNFQHLMTFCTVLKEKSMTAAAQKLFLTQPAVSQQIRHLEEELAVDLLVRGVRQVKPTAEGQLLFEYSQKIIHLVDQAKIAIQTVGAEVKGVLRVGTLNSIGLHLINPVFELFLKSNSSVRLQLRYGEGADVLGLLERDEVDLAILPDAVTEYGGDPSDCERQEVFEEEIWLVASAKERDLPRTVKFSELNRFPVVMLSREYPGFENVLAKEMKKAGETLRPVFETSNVGTLKRAIEAGLGWGFLPAHSVKKQLDSNRLQRVMIQGFDYKVKLVCYLPYEKRNTKNTEIFLNALQKLVVRN